MKLFYSDVFELPLPSNHRFPMAKYRLLRERVQESGVFKQENILPAPSATDEELCRVHEPDYVARVQNGQLSELEIRRIGFPWSPKMVERSRRSTGASIAAAAAALETGFAVNLAGGTHHACPESGQGYCVFNDVAVAARSVQADGLAERILFIDCDVHQGNGTAAASQNDDSLFSFSIHCDKNYPFRKTESDLDVALPEGTGDDEYLTQLEAALDQVFGRFEPDLVFYVSGADPYSDDRLGRLNLSKPGLGLRDRMVMQSCSDRNLPVAVSMAGGYAPNVEDIVDIHFQTVLIAHESSKTRQGI